jgi:hypothetical protein
VGSGAISGMSAIDDVAIISQKLQGHYGPRLKASLEALALAHLGAMLAHFHSVQPGQQGKTGRFWTNQTGQTAARVFGEVFTDDKSVGFFMAHGVEWGIYLEKANNRQNESLRPMIEIYGNSYIIAVRELMK